jgi:transcriptional regulator with XRE-family HTH domain
MKTNVGYLIKSARKFEGVTQAALAKTLKVEPQFVSLIENGHSKLPPKMILKVSKRLRLPKVELLNAYFEDFRKETLRGLNGK